MLILRRLSAKDFVAGNRGSASNRVVGKVKNPFADLTSGASRIVGPLLDVSTLKPPIVYVRSHQS
jgi:hypothetical protein